MIQSWMEIALGELTDHVAEMPGIANNERIIEYHSATTLKARSDQIAWCSAFCCWCFEKAGILSTRNAMARSWLTWANGELVDMPEFGDVVVFARGDPGSNAGHVGFFLLQRNGRIALLSGNDRNRVDVNWFLMDHVIGYRRLAHGTQTQVA